ncbi:hypothetical protein [Methanogenium cariaci]|uniref:hypothetical protein n=1 Tax=Methanogenium cariaci TaxID=2197 RepID=UPI0007860AC9|nr:hypothetical protein [Methanogenium cariaci]
MTGGELITDAQNTWCPGCGNFGIEHALKDVILRLEKRAYPGNRWCSLQGSGAMQRWPIT